MKTILSLVLGLSLLGGSALFAQNTAPKTKHSKNKSKHPKNKKAQSARAK
jgi:hypothetical protein